MSELPTTQQLSAISLRFGSSAKPLKVIAFADLSARGLFIIGRPAKASHISNEVAKIIGLTRVDQNLIQEALKFLKSENKVTQESNKWVLDKEVASQITKEIKLLEDETDEILKRHFPSKIDKILLKKWFAAASADFFASNADDLVKAICKNNKIIFTKSPTLQEILEKSILRFSLTKSRSDLIDGFISFCTGDDQADQRYVMNLVFAMFSAKLVASEVGADPITVEELRDSTFILDTNVLFAINLEGHRLAKSMKALGRALSQINAKIVYLNTTQEEYNGAIRGASSSLIELLKIYPTEVVTSASDDFFKTAKKRGCKTTEDFLTFFSDIKNIPKSIDNVSINKLDDLDIEKIVKKAEIDATLKASLQANYRKINPTEEGKSDFSLKHDSSLIHVVEDFRDRSFKAWVMTIDRTLQSTAIERAGVHGVPTTIFLEGLIQILAVHNSGPKQNASDFAPLLTSIIMRRCIPQERTYKPQDLQMLYSIQEQVTSFSVPRIKKVVAVVSQCRLAGMTANDERMQLAVNRAYQEEKREYEQELSEEKDLRKEAEIRVKKVEEAMEKTRKKLLQSKKSEIIRIAKFKLIKSLVKRFIPILISSIFLFLLIKWSLPKEKYEILSYVASITQLVYFVIVFLKNPIENFRKTFKEAEDIAEKEINE